MSTCERCGPTPGTDGGRAILHRWDARASGVFTGFTPAAEIVKDGEDAVVRVELPGVDVAKDVNVEVDRGHLVIHGERRDERTERRHRESGPIRSAKSGTGSFRRSFKLPTHVTSEAISRVV